MSSPKKFKLKNNRKPTKGRAFIQQVPMYINTKTGNIVTSKEFNECTDGTVIFAGFKPIIHKPVQWHNRIVATKIAMAKLLAK